MNEHDVEEARRTLLELQRLKQRPKGRDWKKSQKRYVHYSLLIISKLSITAQGSPQAIFTA